MATPNSQIHVRPLNSSDEVSVALALFKNSGRKSDWDKLFGLMLDDQLAESGLLIAEQDDQVVGAVWGAMLTRTMAQVIAPTCHQEGSPAEHSRIEVSLLIAITQFLGNLGAEFLTCVVETSDRYDASFKAAGFKFAANVQSMVRPLYPKIESASEIPKVVANLQFRVANKAKDLADLITETYRGSLDCPIVNDYRTADDFLESYSSAEGAKSDGWFVASHQGSDVGCILISTTGTQAEITYMGVGSSFRGNGFGRELLEYGHTYAAQCGVTTVTADVDSKNAYANAIYQQAGYVAYDFNRVFVARIPRKSSTPRS